MTTLITGDLHESDNQRDAYRWQFLEKTLPAMIKEHHVERVLILGDLTEVKDGHRAALVNRLVDDFARIAQMADLLVLKGNHDYLAADVPFFRFLGHLPRMRWINEPTRLALRGLGECWFLPHSTRWADDWAALNLRGADWFFCHQTFGGADLGHGQRAAASAPPFSTKAGDRVISGDVHVPQKLGAITYVGSPTTIDFGDDFEPRVLLLDGHKARSVPVPGPQKQLICVRSLDALERLKTMVREGDVVKVRLELPRGSDLTRAAARAAAHVWAERAGAHLHAVQVTAPEAKRADKTAARDRSQKSDEELVRAYVRKMGKGKATAAVGLKIVEDTP